MVSPIKCALSQRHKGNSRYELKWCLVTDPFPLHTCCPCTRAGPSHALSLGGPNEPLCSALCSLHRNSPILVPEAPVLATCNCGQASGAPAATWPSAALGGCGQHQEERHLRASSLAPTPEAAQRLGVRRFHAWTGWGCPAHTPWGYLFSS